MRYAAAAVVAAFLLPAVRGEEKAFDSNGAKIAYIDEGKGEAVVLLHGFYGSATEMWVRMPFARTQFLPELAKE
jgi:hypothetical protein